MPVENRGARPSSARRRPALRPLGEPLEARQLLTTLDLANIAGVAGPPAVGPYGVQEIGNVSDGGAGFSVALLGAQLTNQSNSVDGDQFQDVLIGAPTIAGAPFFYEGFLGSNAPGRAYLLFGSAEAPNFTQNFLTLTSDERIGNLSQLGTTGQINPVTTTAGFDFDGVIFTTSSTTGLLGASVANAGDINQDGLADFLVGAPGANRAYLVFGNSQFRNLPVATKQNFNLDSPPTGFNIITFQGSAGTLSGRAVAGVGDVFADSTPDIAIGAPDATSTNFTSNGATYLISGGALRALAAGSIVDLNTIGTSGGPGGVAGGITIYGEATNGSAGLSASRAGDINDDGRQDLLIGDSGSPSGAPAGRAYLIYGGANLDTLPVPGTFNLSQVGSTATDAIAGAMFFGSGFDRAGWAVSYAGDFDSDGVDDFQIGSPGFSGDRGRVTLIYGIPNTASTGQINGVFDLNNLPTTLPNATFSGPNTLDLFGYSISATRSLLGPTQAVVDGVVDPDLLVNDAIDDILIGAPQAGSLFNGQVWVVPGRNSSSGTGFTRLVGDTVLNTAAASPPLNALVFDVTTTGLNTPYLGTAVSGLISQTGSTVDQDNVNDLVFGAAGWSQPNLSRVGTVYIIEGGLLPYAGGGPTPPPPPGGGQGQAGRRSTASILNSNLAAPRFGSRFLPSPAIVYKFRWQNVPSRLLFRQFQPGEYQAGRFRRFYHGDDPGRPLGSRYSDTAGKTSTLGQRVFTRGQYGKGLFDARRRLHGD